MSLNCWKVTKCMAKIPQILCCTDLLYAEAKHHFKYYDYLMYDFVLIPRLQKREKKNEKGTT